ncbi:DoxX family protein [Phenylobacterium sp.]|uniref:DoxX family membrane protein n=1 Tax=Phenylobacterium sp. TaxID=1871053 RepID=UPI001216A96C|nr:DoxX family protein [Phenylobacterium sp.]THD63462.1 MAG: DoxX family protein [Phenylobacterium sp.]
MSPADRWGYRVFGLAGIALGSVGLAWDDFALVWQPVPSGVPGRWILAYVVAGSLVLAGAAVQRRRTRALGLAALSVLYALGVVALHLPRIFGHPQVFAAWSGAAEQLALVAGGLVAMSSIAATGVAQSQRLFTVGRLAFGVSLLAFGLAHFVYLSATADLVPKTLPPGPVFWALATGVAHMAAGLAILSGVLARMAAWCLTGMFILFGLVVHAPTFFTAPLSHMTWTANAMNLALIGAAWVIADAVSERRGPGASQRTERRDGGAQPAENSTLSLRRELATEPGRPRLRRGALRLSRAGADNI